MINIFDQQSIIKAKIDRKPDFIVTRTYCNSSKCEIVPRGLIGIYSRSGSINRIIYREIDLGVYLLSQLRSTTHYVLKDIIKDDIIYLHI